MALLGRVVHKAVWEVIGMTPILAALAFWEMGKTILCGIAITCSLLFFISGRMLIWYARGGWQRRLNNLRMILLHARIREEESGGDDVAGIIAKDDVDIVIDRIHRRTLDEMSIPAWAIPCLPEIHRYQKAQEEFPGLDAQSQPMWLILVNALCLLACPIVVTVAAVMYYGR